MFSYEFCEIFMNAFTEHFLVKPQLEIPASPQQPLHTALANISYCFIFIFDRSNRYSYIVLTINISIHILVDTFETKAFQTFKILSLKVNPFWCSFSRHYLRMIFINSKQLPYGILNSCLQKQPQGVIYLKSCFRNIHRKTPVLES